MEVKAGSRLRSATDATEVVVVKVTSGEVDLRFGGHPMVPIGQEPPAGLVPESGLETGTQVGKRYAEESTGIEVLCTKAGPGSLSLGAEPLTIKGAKALPSSD